MFLKPYLQLTRPANLVTAIADILAGMAVAGSVLSPSPAYWLLVSTLGLYGGGVVLNDVFDASLDAIERPERPIPSGRVSKTAAALLGAGLLLIGVLSAYWFEPVSGLIAACVAMATIVYNRFAKHSRFFGPLVMGMCRGGNLLLGISSIPAAITVWWPVTIIPVLYIAAITLISQDEVHGGKRFSLFLAASLYILVHLAQASVAFYQDNLLYALPLIALHAWLIGKPLMAAVQSPTGPMIGKAVKAGVLSLIVMNSAWCMVSGNLVLGLIVLALLPVSIYLGKLFAVT